MLRLASLIGKMGRDMLSIVRPKNRSLFVAALLSIGVASLFMPTHIELGPGSVSGRVHVYLAYIGLFLMPEFFSVIWPIVATHILLVCVSALMLDRLASLTRSRWRKSSPNNPENHLLGKIRI
jgi:hypothetical protein